MKDDKLSQIFDVTPIEKTEIVQKKTDVVSSTKDEVEIQADYNASRKNLHELLARGSLALEHALEVAMSSEHPRAFEVVGGLMKNVADINMQLMDVHKKKQLLLNKEDDESPSKSVTNNAIFVGSTSELSKMLDNLKKGK